MLNKEEAIFAEDSSVIKILTKSARQKESSNMLEFCTENRNEWSNHLIFPNLSIIDSSINIFFMSLFSKRINNLNENLKRKRWRADIK